MNYLDALGKHKPMLSKDEIIATLLELTKTNTVDVTSDWNYPIRFKLVLSNKIILRPHKLGLISDDFYPIFVRVLENPPTIIIYRKEYPGKKMVFTEPFEWGRIVYGMIKDWNNPEDNSGVIDINITNSKKDNKESEQLSLLKE